MAAVPLIVAPSVQQSELPGPMAQDRGEVRFQSEAGPSWGASVGAGLMRAGSAVDEITQQQAAINQQATLKDHDAQLTDALSTILQGDPNQPGSGYLNTRGKAALGASQGGTFDDTQQQVQDAVERIGGDLTDPRMKALFASVAQARVAATMGQMRAHAAQQNQVYAQDASAARGAAGSSAAVLGYNPLPGADNTSPASPYQQGLTTQRAELQSQAAHAGLDGDAAASYVQRGMAQTYTGVIDHLLANNQTQAAKDFFASVKGDLAGVQTRDGQQMVDHVQQVLTNVSDGDSALSTAINVRNQNPGNIGRQEQTLDSMFQSGKIDAKVHDMALQKLRADWAQQRAAQAEGDKAFLGQIWQAKQGNPAMSTADLTPQQIAYATTRGLGPQVDSLLKSGGQNVDDTHSYVALMHMAAEDPVSFANTNLFTQGLTDAHIRQFAAMQAGINKKDAMQQQTTQLMSTAVRTAVGEIKAAGIDPGAKPGTTGAADYGAFQSAAFNALQSASDARRAAKQPPLSDADARGIVLGVIKNEVLGGTGIGGFFKTTGPAYQVVDKIPATDRLQIEQALRATGRPVTPDAVVDLYNRRHP